MNVPYYHKNSTWSLQQLQEGGIFPVDKPLDWTSFDVVAKIRNQLKKALQIKKIKVGHAGTLDPRATGLLLIAFGKATKQLHFLSEADKRYEGDIQLGASTPTYDAESEIDERFPVEHIDQSLIDNLLAEFSGPISQVPPVYSAIKKDGIPLYKYARKGKEVEIKARNVIIHQLELKLMENSLIYFEVICSKGTYIRSLAHDIGKRLESGGFLSRLVRTSIDDYSIEDAWNLTELIEQLDE